MAFVSASHQKMTIAKDRENMKRFEGLDEPALRKLLEITPELDERINIRRAIIELKKVVPGANSVPSNIQERKTTHNYSSNGLCDVKKTVSPFSPKTVASKNPKDAENSLRISNRNLLSKRTQLEEENKRLSSISKDTESDFEKFMRRTDSSRKENFQNKRNLFEKNASELKVSKNKITPVPEKVKDIIFTKTITISPTFQSTKNDSKVTDNKVSEKNVKASFGGKSNAATISVKHSNNFQIQSSHSGKCLQNGVKEKGSLDNKSNNLPQVEQTVSENHSKNYDSKKEVGKTSAIKRKDREVSPTNDMDGRVLRMRLGEEYVTPEDVTLDKMGKVSINLSINDKRAKRNYGISGMRESLPSESSLISEDDTVIDLKVMEEEDDTLIDLEVMEEEDNDLCIIEDTDQTPIIQSDQSKLIDDSMRNVRTDNMIVIDSVPNYTDKLVINSKNDLPQRNVNRSLVGSLDTNLRTAMIEENSIHRKLDRDINNETNKEKSIPNGKKKKVPTATLR